MSGILLCNLHKYYLLIYSQFLMLDIIWIQIIEGYTHKMMTLWIEVLNFRRKLEKNEPTSEDNKELPLFTALNFLCVAGNSP